MSTLLDTLYTKSIDLRRRETVTLPMSGVTVRIRGLMTGELNRLSSTPADRQLFTTVAMAMEDPASGELVLDPRNAEHLDKFNALHGTDTTFLANQINRLSGVGTEATTEGKDNSSAPVEKSSNTPSPSESESLSGY